MHPILFHFGPFSARTYGLLVALAFLGGLKLARAGARLQNLSENAILDLVAILVFSGLFGARLFYVLLNGSYFLEHPVEILKFWEGGLVFYGGFVVAALVGLWYVRRKGLRLGRVADALAPALALGQAIGRWGCFFAGCCYGRPTDRFWGVRFTDPASLAPLNVELHPTQLYESFGSLVIALVLWVQLTKRRAQDGNVFWLYVLLYAVLRFGLEWLRGDDRGPTLGGLYPSQVIALIALLIAGSVLLAQTAALEEAPHER
jgi:phosphatidylglycerol---prolipoprotein diacylglyceryl transferase